MIISTSCFINSQTRQGQFCLVKWLQKDFGFCIFFSWILSILLCSAYSLFWDSKQLLATGFIPNTFTVWHHDSSGHITLGLFLWVIFPAAFLSIVFTVMYLSAAAERRLCALWCDGQMRGDFVYFGEVDTKAGLYEAWDWEGARCTIEPTDRGRVMGGRGARLQQGTNLHLNSTATCLTSVNLWYAVLLIKHSDASVNKKRE